MADRPSKLPPARAHFRALLAVQLYRSQEPPALVEAGRIMAALTRRGVAIGEATVGPADPRLLSKLAEAIHDGCRRTTADGVRPRAGTRVHSLAECDESMREDVKRDATLALIAVGPYLKLR